MHRDSHDHLPENERLVLQLQYEKRMRQQRRREVFWANLPKVFIPVGIAAFIGGLYFALPSYQKMPDAGGLWTLFVFTAPGVAIILIGLIVALGRLIKGDSRKSK